MVEYEQDIGRDCVLDGLVTLAHRGGNHALLVAVRSSGAPRFVRSGVCQLEIVAGGPAVERATEPLREPLGRAFHPAVQGSTTSIPMPSKSRAWRVATVMPRERATAAIWQSAG